MAWTIMPQILKTKLPPLYKLFAIMLANRHGDNGICYPSYQTLADDCSIHRCTAIQIMNDFVEIGCVNKYSGKLPDSFFNTFKLDKRHRQSNFYQINIEMFNEQTEQKLIELQKNRTSPTENQGLSETTRGVVVDNQWGCQGQPPLESQIESQKESKKIIIKKDFNVLEKYKKLANENPEKFTQFEQTFLAWFALYPRKEKPKKAEKTFLNICAQELTKGNFDFDQIIYLGACKNLVNYEGVQKKFIPLPTTWLNAGQWDDEVDPEKNAQWKF
jgi:hypothetical protein